VKNSQQTPKSRKPIWVGHKLILVLMVDFSFVDDIACCSGIAPVTVLCDVSRDSMSSLQRKVQVPAGWSNEYS
jgi:hypothetical protein